MANTILNPTLETSGKPLDAHALELRNRAQVRTWLYVMLLVLIALVFVGGATRLTNSGLSITEWKPIHGVIPPLNAAEWQEEFLKYQQIPEYKEINKGMSLEAFKGIFWWEWSHRLLARSVGLLFALPLAFFWFTGRVDRRLKGPLVGILALGGLQGFIGWWMVSSGLTERTDVSHYRLAIHLVTASIIIGSIMWVARGIAPHADDQRPTPRSAAVAGLLVLMVMVQIYLGALVAGLDAGLVFNEWPTMDGGFFPSSQWDSALGLLNFVDNRAIVQFTHRTFGYLLWLAVATHMIVSLRRAPGSTHARRAAIFFALVTLQAALGITTLLTFVPLGWALAHQVTALIVLCFAIAHWRALAGPMPLSDGSRHIAA